MSANSKTIKLTPNAKTFYPEGYYNRVGYQKSEFSSSNARVDALGQRVRDRFNEEIDVEETGRPSGGLHHQTLKQLKQAHNKAAGPNSQISHASKGSDVFSQNKRKSVINIAPDIKIQKNKAKDQDAQSVITLDRLKKFNDIQGTVAGNMNEQIAAKDAEIAEDANGPAQEHEEG